MKIYDFSDPEEGSTKKTNVFEPSMPEITFNDAYLFNMFNGVREIERSIMEMRTTNDYRPYLLIKLLCSMIVDPGERQRLLADLSTIYKRVLTQIQLRETDLTYPDASGGIQKQRSDAFWWMLTDACIPIIGEIHSYLDRALNIAQRNEIWEA